MNIKDIFNKNKKTDSGNNEDGVTIKKNNIENLYEVLEVNQNASNDVIEKAYKVLAKKYHPDLQEEDKKKNAEEEMKKINEAYAILSNDDKRKKYDDEIKIKEQYKTAQNDMNQQGMNIENIVKEENLTKEQLKAKRKIEKKLNKQARKQYAKDYVEHLRRNGYRIKPRWTILKFLKLILMLCFIYLIYYVLFLIPSVSEFFKDLYEKNQAYRVVADVFKIVFGLFESFFQNIINIFKKDK